MNATTIKHMRMLEEGGVPRRQAEVTIQVLDEIMKNQFASQQDLKDLGQSFEIQLKDLGQSFGLDLKDLGQSMELEINDLRHTIDKMKSDLTIRLGAIMVAGIGVISTLIKMNG